MINNLRINKALWLLVACLSLIAAVSGAFNPDVYGNVVSQKWLPGIVSQDLMTIIAGSLLVFLSMKTCKEDIKKQIVAMSLLSYLFYGYGTYSIERFYNLFYILYIAIFALSFWSIVYGLMNINQDILQYTKVPKWVRYLSAGCLIFIALLFYSLWIARLLPLMQTGEKIEFTYSIFILDMVFVLPASLIIAVLIIKNNTLGLILTPLLFIKAFTLLFSVGLGGLLMPLYNQTIVIGETMFYFILSAIFLVLAILNFRTISFKEKNR